MAPLRVFQTCYTQLFAEPMTRPVKPQRVVSRNISFPFPHLSARGRWLVVLTEFGSCEGVIDGSQLIRSNLPKYLPIACKPT